MLMIKAWRQRGGSVQKRKGITQIQMAQIVGISWCSYKNAEKNGFYGRYKVEKKLDSFFKKNIR